MFRWKGMSQRAKVPYVERARVSLHQYRETMKQLKLEKCQSKSLLRIEKKAARLKILREKYMKKVDGVAGNKENDATIVAIEEKRLGGV
uniref:Uncharacterized protein n=1 Tax=Romanomermis culicivorax TaxID=13658 RepID=A0A915L5A6_ROMCU